METKLRFTKENTLALKGIAIIFLLCYHSFSQKFRFEGYEVDFWPLPMEKAMFISKSMQVCVGIFLFLSVYGLTLSMKKQYKDYEIDRHESIIYIIRRYLKLLSLFFIPFLTCEIVTKLMGLSRYGKGLVEQVGNFVMDMLGVGDIFGTKLLVETWWYMSLAVAVVIFMPFCIRMYKRYGWTLVPMVLVLGSMLVKEFEHMTSWLLIVPIAICFADRNVLERIKGFHIIRNPFGNKLLKFVIMTAVMWVMIQLRMSDWGYGNLRFAMNGFVSVAIICWSYEFIIELPVVKQVLQLLGRHSADIFYTHSFIRGIWFQDFTYSFKYAILIFLVLAAVSLGISFIYDGIRKLTHYREITDKMTDKVVAWADRAL